MRPDARAGHAAAALGRGDGEGGLGVVRASRALVAQVAGEPAWVIDAPWGPIAHEQLERVRRGEPLTHRLRELPGVSRRSMALLGPVEGLMVDG